MLDNILTLIIAPLIVGLLIELFAWWLDKQDNDQK